MLKEQNNFGFQVFNLQLVTCNIFFF